VTEVAMTYRQRANAPTRENATRVTRAEFLLLLSLTLAVLEGAARKWLFAESPMIGYALYFSKDVVFGLLIFLCPAGETTLATTVFQKFVFAGAALTLCGATIAAQFDLNWIGAVLTLRATILLPIMAVLAAPRLAHVSVKRAGVLFAFWTVVNFALGAVQYSLPSDHILNTYADSSLAVVAIGDNVRATGTFSYISGLGVISVFGIWAAMVLLSSSHRLGFVVGGLSALSGVGCGLVSISRGPVAIGILVVALWLFFSGVLRNKSVQGFVVACALGALLIISGFGESLQHYTNTILNRHDEAQESEKLADRTIKPLFTVLDVAGVAPLGNGLGTEQVAGVWATTGTANYGHYEDPWPRLVLETGVLGVLGFIITCVGAIFALWTATKTSCCLARRGVTIATLFTAASFFLTNVIYNHIASGMLWPLIALVLGTTVCSCGTSNPREQERTE